MPWPSIPLVYGLAGGVVRFPRSVFSTCSRTPANQEEALACALVRCLSTSSAAERNAKSRSKWRSGCNNVAARL